MIVLPQVDPNYWLGGSPSTPCRFSVIFRKGYYEVWDLHCPNGGRFSKIAERPKALKLVSTWAREPVTLSDAVLPPFKPEVEAFSERKWGGKGQGRVKKQKNSAPGGVPDLPEPDFDPDDPDFLGSEDDPVA